jgi:hypothetical protein
MNRFLVIVNRCLYGTVILAGAGIVAAVADSRPDPGEEAIPLQLPTIALPRATTHPAVAFPDRNVFDPDGVRWLPPAPVAADAKPKAPEPVLASARGLIVLPGLQGVLTDNGFVSQGQALPEGPLRRITEDGYVVAGQTGDREVKFDTGRDQAIHDLFHPVSLSPMEGDKVEVPHPAQATAVAPAAPQQGALAPQPRTVRPGQQVARPKPIPPPSRPPVRPNIPPPGTPGGMPLPGQAPSADFRPPQPGQPPQQFIPPGVPGQTP